MPGTCSLFPPFGDPWPSCLLPSQSPALQADFYRLSHQGLCGWSGGEGAEVRGRGKKGIESAQGGWGALLIQCT